MITNNGVSSHMNKTITQENLPKHIAITMDGNGRWAKEKGQNRIFGHNQGIQAVRDTVAVSYTHLRAHET